MNAMAKKIAICNQKGGVGKTSTAISLVCALALEGKKSLLIDLDPQGNATSGLGVDKKQVKQSIYHALLEQTNPSEIILNPLIENLFLVPADANLSRAEV